MVELATKITKSVFFTNLVLILIVTSGVLVGIETYPQFNESTILGQGIQWIQTIILFFFLAEIVLKIIACGSKPWQYFTEGWNIFDFIVVAVCFLPFSLESVSVIRMARILRSLRMITVLPRLRLLVSALLRSIPSLGYIGMLLGLHFYIYSVIGTVAFGDNDPIRFGSLHKTATTLFQVLTLEGWNDVRDAQTMGSDVAYDDSWKQLVGENRKSVAQPLVATIYFSTFIVLGTMIMLNLFTGVIISSMEEAEQETASQTRSEHIAEKGYITLQEEFAMLHDQLQKVSTQLTKLQESESARNKSKEQG